MQLLAAREPQDLRLAEGSLEGTEGKMVGEVEQRARRGGRRDPVMAGDVAGMEGAGAVDGDAPAPGVMLRDHVDGSPPGAAHLPQRSCGVMAENGAVAAREHRRHLAPARSDGPVPHGVHPAVEREEPAGAQPRVDRARRDARREQLRSAHHAMLLPGDPGDQLVVGGGCAGFAPYLTDNLGHPPILTRHPARITTAQCQMCANSAPDRVHRHMASQTRRTTDHDEIRRWVEEHGGRPARVRSTAGGDDAGVLRIDFPAAPARTSSSRSRGTSETFEESNLAFVYQEQKADEEDSTFFKLVKRDS